MEDRFYNFKTTTKMKKLLLLSFLILPFISRSQIKDTIPKIRDDSSYFFRGIAINIESGHGDSINVLFSASIDTAIWNHRVLKYNGQEMKAFASIGRMLSSKAQYSLKNPMSFEPLKKEFFFTQGKNFVSVYEMMGRNDLGNLLETKAVVQIEFK